MISLDIWMCRLGFWSVSLINVFWPDLRPSGVSYGEFAILATMLMLTGIVLVHLRDRIPE